MRYFLILASLVFVGSVWAEDFNFNSPRAKAAMEKYQYDKKDLLRDLEAALEHERTKGSLEEAIKIRDAIATLKQQPDAPVANAQIPADAVEWNGHYYKLFKTAVTHPVALMECKNKGGHLVRIENSDENKFVNRLVVTQMAPRRAFFDGWVYVDGTDSAKENSWIYSDGTPATYLNWLPGEPHNDPRYDEDCLAMAPNTSAGFGDVMPGVALWYICEWDGPAGSTQRAKKIPADAVKYKGNYYKVYDEPLQYSAAQKRCEIMGGHLVKIESADEQQLVANITKNRPREYYYVDGSDELEEGVWKDSDGKTISFIDWAPGEPNNWRGIEHWLVISPSHRKLFDYFASGPGFICEWEGGGNVIKGSKTIPSDAVEWNGHHYWVSNEGTNWHEAKAKCEKMGGHLARIETDGENKFITQLSSKFPGESRMWIDGSDASQEGTWRFYNNTPVIYTNWASGEPSGGHGGSHHIELMVNASNRKIHGLWNDTPGDWQGRGFICEWDGSAPDTPTKPERTKPKSEEPIKKLSPKHAKRVLDDANLWEGKPGVWFLKRANNFSGRTYERLSQSNRIRSALASVNGRLPTPDEMNNPPSRR